MPGTITKSSTPTHLTASAPKLVWLPDRPGHRNLASAESPNLARVWRNLNPVFLCLHLTLISRRLRSLGICNRPAIPAPSADGIAGTISAASTVVKVESFLSVAPAGKLKATSSSHLPFLLPQLASQSPPTGLHTSSQTPPTSPKSGSRCPPFSFSSLYKHVGSR